MARDNVQQYPDEYYIPELLRQGILTDAEMRKEYSRLRAIANSRLERMEGTRYTNYQSYIKNVGKYVPLSDIKTRRELIYKLSEVQKFVSARTSSISGIRELERQTLETAHERGLTFLNKDNLYLFGEFMEEARAKGYAKIYGSERVAELFGTAAKKGLTADEIMSEFGYWIENREALEKAPKFRNKEAQNSGNYKRFIEQHYNHKDR